jgi:HPt (histidine-containing phosphotransfer) domain-containing protein
MGMTELYDETFFTSDIPSRDDVAFDRLYLVHHTMQSVELECEIMELFRKQLPDILGQLLASRTAEDWRFHAHTLKGSALAVGAFKIGSLARQLELPENAAASNGRTKILHSLQIAAAEFEKIARHIYG